MPSERGRRLIDSAGVRLEPHRPSFLTSHPTALGLVWMAAVVALLVGCDLDGGPGWLRAALALTAAPPPLVVTLVVLSQTPRSHLEYERSILTHFFARFLALFSAFIFWLGSVVISGASAVRLRGRSAGPTSHRIPEHLLAEAPRTCQSIAARTSSRTRCSTSAVTSTTANEVGHIAPSSSVAVSSKFSVG